MDVESILVILSFLVIAGFLKGEQSAAPVCRRDLPAPVWIFQILISSGLLRSTEENHWLCERDNEKS